MRTNGIAEIIAKRDGMTLEEATEYIKDEMKYVSRCIAEGDFQEAEDYFQDAFSLESDYLLDAII